MKPLSYKQWRDRTRIVPMITTNNRKWTEYHFDGRSVGHGYIVFSPPGAVPLTSPDFFAMTLRDAYTQYKQHISKQ